MSQNPQQKNTTPSTSAPVATDQPKLPPLFESSVVIVPEVRAAPIIGSTGEFSLRVLIVLGLTFLLLSLLLFSWFARDILMLAFASVLLAVIISWPADLLTKYTKLKRSLSLAVVLVALVLLLAGVGYLMGNAIADQVTEMRRTLPDAIGRLTQQLQKSPRGAFILEQTADIRTAVTEYITRPETLGRVGGVITATFGVLANIGLVVAMAFLLAINPSFYVKGLVYLIPLRARPRFQAVLQKTGNTLQWWFFGQLCSMIAIGLLTYIGLAILGVPLALTLAVLAGLLNFIPNFGPILAAIPAVIIALAPQGQQHDLNYSTALYVGLLYIGIQLAEGNIITPFIQHRAVALPPALIVLFQVVLALMVGPVGLILATPALAALLVFVKMLYIEDTLGDRNQAASP